MLNSLAAFAAILIFFAAIDATQSNLASAAVLLLLSLVPLAVLWRSYARERLFRRTRYARIELS